MSSPIALAAPLVAKERAARNVRIRALVADHATFVWRLLRRLGVSADDAEDATQQVYLIAVERIEDIRDGCERTFLYGTALRVAYRWRRNKARRRDKLAGDDVVRERRDPSPGPESLADEGRARRYLDQILRQMPEDLSVAFVLFELEGMTMSEMATMLGIPSGTVASRLRRARKAFQTAVGALHASEERREP